MIKPMIPIAFPCPDVKDKLTILVGDVGGTKTHLAIFEMQAGKYNILHKGTFASTDYRSLEDMMIDFLPEAHKPDRVSIGVAGPIVRGEANITNLDWVISEQHLQEYTGIGKAYIINDLVANSYGLAGLNASDLLTLYEGDPTVGGNAVIISPGTGLGEAGMYWDGTHYHPFGTEGGHTDYAPETPQDMAMLTWLQEKYGHVSWERVVSGMGIIEIYAFLSDLDVEGASQKLSQKFGLDDPGAAISKGALKGDALCIQTMDSFLRNLSNEAANLVLKLMGTGGVFIGGGILPKNMELLQKQSFVDFFLAAGRMGKLLEKVPIRIVLNDKTALIGAALYGYFND